MRGTGDANQLAPPWPSELQKATMKLRKETENRRHGRWYDDACGTAFALELIGERWSLLIVRELMLGGRRFTELRAGLPGISAKVLTERLAGLEGAGILRRRKLAPPAASQIYELTPWGYAAEEPVKLLGAWAAKSPKHDPTLPLSPASFMISLRTMFDPALAEGLLVSGALNIGDESFLVAVASSALRAERGDIDAPDFTLSAPTATPLAAAVYGKVPVEALAGAGVRLAGDPAAIGRFIDLFHLPAKV
ncbi:MAG: winged helix-turn-helix transcriptional regulator [Novosphingobium sp.]